MTQRHDAPERHGELVIQTQKPRLRRPRKYRVVLLNDDYTPMDFVVWLLMQLFHKPEPEATRLMMTIHMSGRGVCGVYPHDIARTKVWQVQQLAGQHGHPLQSVLEAVEPDDEQDN